MISSHIKFQKKINIKFINTSLLIKALTHKSASKKNNNEKLEFLGDRVIGLVLAEKLFKLYPLESEGDLDKRFAKLVNRKTCYSVGWDIGIQHHVIIGDKKKKISTEDEKIISDCCEALIGAIYIDRGYKYVENFILRLWKKEIQKSNITVLDPKTKLQEFSLKHYKKLPVYKFIKKMMTWLLDQQMENSLFPKIANKHPVEDILVTNRVLFVLKKYFEIT